MESTGDGPVNDTGPGSLQDPSMWIPMLELDGEKIRQVRPVDSMETTVLKPVSAGDQVSKPRLDDRTLRPGGALSCSPFVGERMDTVQMAPVGSWELAKLVEKTNEVSLMSLSPSGETRWRRTLLRRQRAYKIVALMTTMVALIVLVTVILVLFK